MANDIASKAIPLPQLTLAAAGVTAGYALIGTFTGPLEMASITSTLDAAVQVSFDAINDHIAVPAGSTVPVFIQLNFKSNRLVFPTTSVYAKRIGTPTTGSIYINGFRASFP